MCIKYTIGHGLVVLLPSLFEHFVISFSHCNKIHWMSFVSSEIYATIPEFAKISGSAMISFDLFKSLQTCSDWLLTLELYTTPSRRYHYLIEAYAPNLSLWIQSCPLINQIKLIVPLFVYIHCPEVTIGFNHKINNWLLLSLWFQHGRHINYLVNIL